MELSRLFGILWVLFGGGGSSSSEDKNRASPKRWTGRLSIAAGEMTYFFLGDGGRVLVAVALDLAEQVELAVGRQEAGLDRIGGEFAQLV